MKYSPTKSHSFLAPLFWIAVTAFAMTYGPVVWGRVRGTISPDATGRLLLDRTPAPLRAILGSRGSVSTSGGESSQILSAADSLPPPPQSAADVTRYVQEVVDRITKEVVEKSTEKVTEKKQEVATNVCRQIVTTIEERCGITDSTDQ